MFLRTLSKSNAASEGQSTGPQFLWKLNPRSCEQQPPWPNGQGVGLLIRRLRVRVPQGVHRGRPLPAGSLWVFKLCLSLAFYHTACKWVLGPQPSLIWTDHPRKSHTFNLTIKPPSTYSAWRASSTWGQCQQWLQNSSINWIIIWQLRNYLVIYLIK